jgi:hypothetical protein
MGITVTAEVNGTYYRTGNENARSRRDVRVPITLGIHNLAVR